MTSFQGERRKEAIVSNDDIKDTSVPSLSEKGGESVATFTSSIAELPPSGVPVDLFHHLLTSTHCLLWVADVREELSHSDATNIKIFDNDLKTCLHWDLRVLSEDTVVQWLPTAVQREDDPLTVFWTARREEDRITGDENSWTALSEGKSGYQQEFFFSTADGKGRWLLETVQIKSLDTAKGTHHWWLSGVCIDITERKQAEEKLAYQVTHDTLTGLPNRTYLMQKLSDGLVRMQETGEQVALLFLDMDNFKIINDSLGHAAGDDVLNIIARRLKSCVRAGDIVARLSGDEFTILMAPVPDKEIVLDAAHRIANSLQLPIPLHGQTIFPACSIGVAFSSDTTGDYRAETLLRNADTAMYYAKSVGKGRVERFLPDMNTRAVEQFEIGSELRRSVDKGDLELHYQPILDLVTGRVCEVEALVRWKHPLYGSISPEKFVPIAEETGSIIALGIWVLREACWQMHRWRARWPELIDKLTISVNLSVRQLQDPNLVKDVVAILAETQLPATILKLEITETAMMLDAAANRQTVRALRELGVKIAMDDFGIGYLSMAYLDYLPVDTIKIDRTFVQRLGSRVGREDSDAIVRAIIAMAKAMGIEVTSEGIEGPEQLAHLKAMACDRGQGHYFARPLTGEDFASFLMSTTPHD